MGLAYKKHAGNSLSVTTLVDLSVSLISTQNVVFADSVNGLVLRVILTAIAGVLGKFARLSIVGESTEYTDANGVPSYVAMHIGKDTVTAKNLFQYALQLANLSAYLRPGSGRRSAGGGTRRPSVLRRHVVSTGTGGTARQGASTSECLCGRGSIVLNGRASH